MTLSQFLLILRARRKAFFLPLFSAILLAVSLNALLPKSYKGVATLVLNYKGVDPVTGMMMPAQMMPGYVATQADIIGSKGVALKVVEHLHLQDNPALRQRFYDEQNGEGEIRQWLAEQLLRHLDVVPSRDSSVLDVRFKAPDPVFAATVANTFADEYLQTAIQLSSDPLKRVSGYFSQQIKIYRDNLEAAQKKLSGYQQKNGLTSVDSRLDVETARLNDLSSQLVLVQGQLMDAMSRQRQVQHNNAAEAPDIISNSLIQSLKSSLAQAEAKFSDLSQRLGENHPGYQASKAEVAKLRAALDENIRATSNGVVNNARILQQHEAELRLALERQRSKVLELNRARDELMVLTKDVESAQRAYDAATQRFSQTSMEGQANQGTVAVLSPATPPIESSFPKPLLNIALSVLLGTMLGLGFVVIAEQLDRRLRSASDMADVLQAPVLGVIQWTTPHRSKFSVTRPRFMRRLVAQ